jgi:hypothetical protein
METNLNYNLPSSAKRVRMLATMKPSFYQPSWQNEENSEFAATGSNPVGVAMNFPRFAMKTD